MHPDYEGNGLFIRDILDLLRIFKRRVLSDKELVRRRATRWKQVVILARIVIYRKIPQIFKLKATVEGLLHAALRLGLLAVFLGAPYIAKLITDDHSSTITRTLLFAQAGILALGAIAKVILDSLEKSLTAGKRRSDTLQEISVALDQAFKTLEKSVLKLKRNLVDADLDSVLGDILRCIEGVVKLCTDNPDHGHCCATLLVFEANDMIRIRARSLPTRSKGAPVPIQSTLAYLAAKYAEDEQWVIHRFKGFLKARKPQIPYRRLSSPAPPDYQSILFLPLPATIIPGTTAPKVRRGVVSIDAGRAFEFVSSGTIILTRVSPYLGLINLILANHQYGVEPEN